MEYAKIENNIVKEIISTNDKVSTDYTELPKDFEIVVGDNIEFFDENYLKKSAETLISEGLLEDVCGEWFTETHRKVKITNPFFDMSEKNWVRKAPDHPTDKLEDGEWVEQPEKKIEYDKKIERVWRDSELYKIVDHYQKPLVWAETDEATKTAVSKYRKALLDYPQESDFPYGKRPVSNL